MKLKHLLSGLILYAALGTGLCQTPDFTGLTIVVNPGHGGHDSDDRGMPNGFWESESNLTKGLWLRDLLEARGANVVMTRELNRTEDDLPLSQIVEISNTSGGDLFISIHSNAGNQVSNYALTIFNGKSETPTIPEAKVWAQVLWEHLVSNKATYWTSVSPHYIGDLTLNPTWTSGYGVLYLNTLPSIISEGSFHDYQPEMDRLLNLDYRKQEAWNMLYAMEDYFQLEGQEPHGIISGIIRDSLLAKPSYNIAGSPDKYMNVNGTLVRLLETGESYQVDEVNTGFYMFDSLAPGSYNLVFSAFDYFNDTVSVEVLPHQFTYHNHWMHTDTSIAPVIVSHIPADNETISCFDPVSITFNKDMDSASVAESFVISPAIEGTFTWDEKHLTVTFQPDVPYETNTHYTITLTTGVTQKWGIHLEEEYSFGFTTGDRNRYNLLTSFPAGNETDICPYLQFRLVFDAPLNSSSLINAVEIRDNDNNVILTKGAIISEIDGKGHYYFSPALDLSYETDYTLAISGSITDEEGIPLVNEILIPFTTMAEPVNTVVINEMDLTTDEDKWNIDFGSSVALDPASFLYKWKKTLRSGEASTMLRYNFTSPGGSCILVPQTGSVSLLENSNSIALWIYGEMSHNQVSAGFDNETEVELGTIDFAGWNYCLAVLPDGATSLSYIKLSQTAEGASSGDLYFDALSQKLTTGSTDDASKQALTVYPNPLLGNTAELSGLPEGESEYRIVSLSGQTLQEGTVRSEDPRIIIKDEIIQQGVFLLRISGNQFRRSVLVKTGNN